MRAIWTGAIGFGLVNIPVRIHTAVDSQALDLDMLDKRNNASVKYQRINSNTGNVVAWDDIVKGYKYNDSYVVLTNDDFEKALPEKSKIIHIEEFVAEQEVDSMYFETPYYLEPGKSGEHAYALLHKALVDTGKVAVGSFVMRNREDLCLLKAGPDNVLILIKIRFSKEIRTTENITIPKTPPVKPAELKMAITLINHLTNKKFDITKYKDTYTDELMKIIEQKSKGKKITQPKFKLVHHDTVDLMEQLKESLNKKKAG